MASEEEPKMVEATVNTDTTGEAGEAGEAGEGPSKKALKKAEKLAAKDAKKAESEATKQAEAAAANAIVETKAASPVGTELFGYLPLVASQTKTDRKWTKVAGLDATREGEEVWVRARLQESRCKGTLGFLVLREKFCTIQAVLDGGAVCPKPMIKWSAAVPLESIVDVLAKVVRPKEPITGATQQVELSVQRMFCVHRAASELPFQLKDANRSDPDCELEGAITVSQDTRLDNRIMDLRTLANQAIFCVSSMVCTLFREYLLREGFTEFHSPKLNGGQSEGGANVFTLKYFGRDACLAQSPQLFKQMAICGDLDRVFEIGPVFRAENSNTHRHLCEFTGMDMEMAIKEHYDEVLDVLDEMFRYIFAGLETRCSREIETVFRQHPNRPFAYLPSTLRLPFQEAVQLLREGGAANVPDDLYTFDFSTEQEKLLGRMVYAKYHTDFYFVINYPLGVRPFYTMPNPADPKWSNSYDFFMRGEEIVSGAQRIHDPDMLSQRAAACGVDPKTIKPYIDSFRLGAFPHGGCGIGLERVVMLFLGLPNIRKSCMFPRDPKRLEP